MTNDVTPFLQKLIYILALSLWFGGLTFYALAVVPAGTDVVGSTTQGFITQRVTWRLNVVGALCLACMLLPTVPARRRNLWIAWTLMAVTQAALFMIHAQLATRLEPETQSVPDPASFYSLHRVYLLTTAGQWFACLWHVCATIGVWQRKSSGA